MVCREILQQADLGKTTPDTQQGCIETAGPFITTMKDPDKLTQAEMDYLLERFDQAEPDVQRRLVATLVAKAKNLEDENADLKAQVESMKHARLGLSREC
jgi:hypothetical protein